MILPIVIISLLFFTTGVTRAHSQQFVFEKVDLKLPAEIGKLVSESRLYNVDILWAGTDRILFADSYHGNVYLINIERGTIIQKFSFPFAFVDCVDRKNGIFRYYTEPENTRYYFDENNIQRFYLRRRKPDNYDNHYAYMKYEKDPNDSLPPPLFLTYEWHFNRSDSGQSFYRLILTDMRENVLMDKQSGPIKDIDGNNFVREDFKRSTYIPEWRSAVFLGRAETMFFAKLDDFSITDIRFISKFPEKNNRLGYAAYFARPDIIFTFVRNPNAWDDSERCHAEQSEREMYHPALVSLDGDIIHEDRGVRMLGTGKDSLLDVNYDPITQRFIFFTEDESLPNKWIGLKLEAYQIRELGAE